MSLQANFYVVESDVARKHGLSFDKDIFRLLKKSFNSNKQQLFSDLIKHANNLNVNSNSLGIRYSLYESQIKVLKYISEEPYFLGLLHNAPGSGKTTLVPPIVNLVTNGVFMKSNDIVIFTCMLQSVIYETAENCLNIGINFAFAYLDEKDNIIFLRSDTYATTNVQPDNINLIICDFFVAYKLMYIHDLALKKYHNSFIIGANDSSRNIEERPKDTMLIVDEATYKMDKRDGQSCHLFTKMFINLMKVAPPKTLILSATMPSREEMPDFYNNIASKYISNKTQIKIKSFNSSEFEVGCHLINPDGSYFIPHQLVASEEQKARLLYLLDNTPFLNRFYTKAVVKNLPGSKNHRFETQNECQKVARTILTNMTINEYEQQHKILHEERLRNVTLEAIFTNLKRDFSTGTLIVGLRCLELAKECLRIIDEVVFPEKANFNPVSEYKKYKADKDKYQAHRENLGRSITDARERDRFVNDTSGPIWNFGDKYLLMSKKHLSTDGVQNFAISLDPNDLDDLTEDFANNSWIIKLLCHGIGIYSSNYPNIITKKYLDKVLYMYKRKSLLILVADGSISYGTNLEFSNMIISESIESDKSLTDHHSLKTLLQLMGRIGRAGLSTSAYIYVLGSNSKIVDKMLHFINGYDSNFEEFMDDHDEKRNLNLGLRHEWPEIIGETPIDRFAFFSSELINGV